MSRTEIYLHHSKTALSCLEIPHSHLLKVKDCCHRLLNEKQMIQKYWTTSQSACVPKQNHPSILHLRMRAPQQVSYSFFTKHRRQSTRTTSTAHQRRFEIMLTSYVLKNYMIHFVRRTERGNKQLSENDYNGHECKIWRLPWGCVVLEAENGSGISEHELTPVLLDDRCEVTRKS